MVNKLWLTVLAFGAALGAGAAEMVLMQGGEFTMGSADGKADEKPHQVEVSPFYIDKYEVTQKEYSELTGQNPSRFQGDEKPVERVRWTDAAFYCNLRSQKEGLKPCYNTETWECDFSADGYRLPTEAEWEFAARGGNKSKGYTYSGSNVLGDVGWYRENVKIGVDEVLDPDYGTHPVAMKSPNELGLYDMSGNVAEWCQDRYGRYSSDAQTDPTGPETGTIRVYRGGYWFIDAEWGQVFFRDAYSHTEKNDFVGLRLAL